MSSLKHSIPKSSSQTHVLRVLYGFGDYLQRLKMLLFATENGFLLSYMVVNDLGLE